MVSMIFSILLLFWVFSPLYDRFVMNESKRSAESALPVATEQNVIDDFASCVRAISWETTGISCRSSDVRLFVENGDVLSDGTRIARFSMLLPVSASIHPISDESLCHVKRQVNRALVERFQKIRNFSDYDQVLETLSHHPAFVNGILVDNVFITESLLVFEVFEVANTAEKARAEKILRRLHLLPDSRKRRDSAPK